MATEVKTDPATDTGKPPEVKKEEVKPETAEQLAEKLKAAEAKVHAANEEAKKSRLDLKESKAKADRLEKAWKIAQGEDPDAADPAKLEKERTAKQMRKLHLKSAFVSEAAREMHDADFSFDAVANEFADVTVDLETGKVDKAALKGKLEEIKKAKPFLFVQQMQDDGKNKTPPGPPDKGTPKDGQNPWTKWQDLLKTDRAAAQKFYVENRAAIGANMPK